jgi:hypothetical protein
MKCTILTLNLAKKKMDRKYLNASPIAGRIILDIPSVELVQKELRLPGCNIGSNNKNITYASFFYSDKNHSLSYTQVSVALYIVKAHSSLPWLATENF